MSYSSSSSSNSNYHREEVVVQIIAGICYPLTFLLGLFVLYDLIRKKSFKQLITIVVLILVHLSIYMTMTFMYTINPAEFLNFTWGKLFLLDLLCFGSWTAVLLIFWKLCYMYWLPAMQLDAWCKAEQAMTECKINVLENNFTIKQKNFKKWNWWAQFLIVAICLSKTILLNWAQWPFCKDQTTQKRIDITYQCYCYF